MGITMRAAMSGPVARKGIGQMPAAYKGQPTHEIALASTKNVMSGCRFTNDIRCSPFLAGYPFTGLRKLGTAYWVK
jgi:hypothetical protein